MEILAIEDSPVEFFALREGVDDFAVYVLNLDHLVLFFDAKIRSFSQLHKNIFNSLLFKDSEKWSEGAMLSEGVRLFGGGWICRRGRIILIILTSLTILTISVGDSTLIHTFFDAAFGHEAVLHSLQQFAEHICRLMYECDAEIGHFLIGHAQND